MLTRKEKEEGDETAAVWTRAGRFCCIDQSKQDRVKTHTEETHVSRSCLSRTHAQRLTDGTRVPGHRGLLRVSDCAANTFKHDQNPVC